MAQGQQTQQLTLANYSNMINDLDAHYSRNVKTPEEVTGGVPGEENHDIVYENQLSGRGRKAVEGRVGPVVPHGRRRRGAGHGGFPYETLVHLVADPEGDQNAHGPRDVEAARRVRPAAAAALRDSDHRLLWGIIHAEHDLVHEHVPDAVGQ